MRPPRPPRARLAVGLLALGASSCFANQPRFVSVDPEYGYVDGCTDVVLQGSKLGTTATATVGGAAMAISPAEEDPSLPAWAQDVGFKYFGVTPAKADGAKGFVDVVMTVDGKELTLKDGFYYMTCPGTVYAEVVDPTADLTAGAEVTLSGCGLDAATVTGALLGEDGAEVATFPISSVCGKGVATFSVPAVPAGTYWVELRAGDGTTWGGACLPDPSDSDESGAVDTADPCASLVAVTVVEGGA